MRGARDACAHARRIAVDTLAVSSSFAEDLATSIVQSRLKTLSCTPNTHFFDFDLSIHVRTRLFPAAAVALSLTYRGKKWREKNEIDGEMITEEFFKREKEKEKVVRSCEKEKRGRTGACLRVTDRIVFV